MKREVVHWPEPRQGPILAPDVVQISFRDGVTDMTRRCAHNEPSVLSLAIRSHLGQFAIVFDAKMCL